MQSGDEGVKFQLKVYLYVNYSLCYTLKAEFVHNNKRTGL